MNEKERLRALLLAQKKTTAIVKLSPAQRACRALEELLELIDGQPWLYKTLGRTDEYSNARALLDELRPEVWF
jgi:hypothetical protein